MAWFGALRTGPAGEEKGDDDERGQVTRDATHARWVFDSSSYTSEMPPVNDSAGKAVRSAGDARQRANLVRMVAQIVSADVLVADLWARCAIPIALLVDGDRMSVALRGPDGDRLVFASNDDDTLPVARPLVEPDSVAAAVLLEGETVVKEGRAGAAVGVPVRFGRQILGAIVVEGVPAEAYEHIPLLESCALYVAARIDHESTLEKTERYARLALIDGLTGVANRRKFDEMLSYEWTRAAREGAPIALAIVDLDFFKQFNDSYGHQAGDLCLQQVARALGECVKRPTDLLARYGGEEFVALLPSTDLNGATALAESMRELLSELGIAHAGTSLGRVTLSAGVASALPRPGSSPDELVRSADEALYAAKSAGRNRVVAQGYISEAPAAEGVTRVAPSNLPIAVTRLIGRRAEIADLRELIEEHRLVTVLGFGGTGKTRVALHVASELVDRYPDGVWFVDLASLTDYTLVPAAIGAVVGATIPTDATALSALAQTLAAKHALLVVDNCEHVVAAVAAAIAGLVRACPALRILTTTREPLDLEGEAIYRLPLLTLPARPADLTADEAIRADAVALFVARATAANRRFTLTNENAPAVAELVHRLDGIALALELAAARLGSTDLDALSAQLDERFRSLTGGDRAALPRRQTMQATIDWTFDLLSAEEQRLFARLAIFAGTFSMKAVAETCFEPKTTPDEVAELTFALVRKSLVVAESASGEDRYYLLESLRHDARERLIGSGEYDVIADRHAVYALGLAENLYALYQTMPSRAWYLTAERHIANFRAALDWTLGARTDVLNGARLAGVLAPLLVDYSGGEGVRWLLLALNVLPPETAPALEAFLWHRIASATRIVPPAQLRDAAERALQLYRTLDDRPGLAHALRSLAQIVGWYYREERDLADQLACEAIALARLVGDPLLVADSLKTRGLTIAPDNPVEKRSALEESLALFKMFGNDRQIGSVLTWISEFEFSEGNEERALAYGRDALRYARAAADARGLQETATTNLAIYSVSAGDWETARRIGAESLKIAAELRAQATFTWAVQALAGVSAGTGDPARAARLLGFCDARSGIVHAARQTDQAEDILYRRLLADLRESLGAEAAAREMDVGAAFDEGTAMREALAV
jgi:diguanylate cyclase (GGDEF)-like protein